MEKSNNFGLLGKTLVMTKFLVRTELIVSKNQRMTSWTDSKRKQYLLRVGLPAEGNSRE